MYTLPSRFSYRCPVFGKTRLESFLETWCSFAKSIFTSKQRKNSSDEGLFGSP
jgi:hypothetical protein